DPISMLRGLYTAAAGMMTQQSRHDTDVQNIANINTPGYKQVNSVARSFPEVLISMIGGGAENPNPQLGKLNTGVFAEANRLCAVTDPATGQNIPFDQSGKYVDPDGNVTYKPEAYFTVRNADGGIGYTKDGSFKVTPDGLLLTSAGYQVLDANNQPIRLTGSVDSLKVNEQGFILNPATGAPGTRLGIAVVGQPGQMVRTGDGLFKVDDTAAAGVRALGNADRVEVRQHYLEQSNVDSSAAVVDMNTALRAYEANQKVVQFYDKSLDKAVNEVGKRKLDVIADNIANIDTDGYKRKESSFEDVLTTVTQQPDGFKQNGRPDNMVLVNNQGYFVLDRNGRQISVANNAKVAVDQDGQVIVKNAAGTSAVATIQLASPVRPDALVQMDGNLFVIPGNLTKAQVFGNAPYTPAASGTTIRSGYLEQSNVDYAQEITDMMQAQRAYQLSARALTSSDTMMNLANNIRG
ncbi:hypothetical protein BGX30_005788, partial [Mortierella sp. GBA39]